MTGATRNRWRRGATGFGVVLVLAGCPKRFDPRAETVRTSPNAEADREYHDAKARLDVGDAKEAQERFADFLQKHPDDPLAPSARIGEARAELSLGEAKQATAVLEPMAQGQSDEPTATRARYLLGLALHKTGDWNRSRELLRPFVPLINGDDGVELHAVLADDSLHLDDNEDALREYGLFFDGARPAERLYIRDKVSERVAALPAVEAARLWALLPHDGVAAAYLGRRVAADRRAAGDERTALAILDESRSARDRAGLEEPKPATAPRPREGGHTVALVLPLSGPKRALGERALRGALLAADLLSPNNLPSGTPIELKVRDSGSDPAKAVAAVEQLAGEGVAALVSSPDRVESQMAVPRAEQLGLPLLELAPDDTRRGDTTFKMVRPSDARARALARLAVKSGARSVAVLAPDSAFGRNMAAAFVDEARRLGARIAGDVRYPETATTFIEPVRRVAQGSPEALFVPAPASQLQLIAPQLASSGVTGLAGMKPTGKLARLYASADGLNDKLLQSTAKYLEGAVLAPVYFADANDERGNAFLERYRQAYGEDPSSLDALAYDAVRAARIALDHADGGALGVSLSHLGESGLTGELAFAAGGERAGQPPLYVVDNGAVRPLK